MLMEEKVRYDRHFAVSSFAMGLSPGGRMRQEIYEDSNRIEEWDQLASSRCFVHLVNSRVWNRVTSETSPTTPPMARDYARAGLPWFDYYSEGTRAVEASDTLAGLKGLAEMYEEKEGKPLWDNDSVVPEVIVAHGARRVREGTF